MENYTKTMTAWTPSFGMSTLRPPLRALTARPRRSVLRLLQGDAVSIVRVKGVFPGIPTPGVHRSS